MKPRLFLAAAFAGVLSDGSGIRSEDCNENAIDDAREVMDGTSPDCNGNGIPDGCDSRSVVELLEGVRAQLGLGSFADLDRNGRLDIVAYDDLAATGIFLRNKGGRNFEPSVTLALGDFVQNGMCGLVAADFDLDGAEDLLLANGEMALPLWNRTPSPPEYDCDASGVPDACEGTIQDCDADGIPDACDADSDRDGVPDRCEPPRFRRGDANADGLLDIADPLWILGVLFLRGDLAESRLCLDAHDANDDGAVEITDAVRVLDFLFLGSAAPPPPLECGPDPDDGAHLGCASYSICL